MDWRSKVTRIALLCGMCTLMVAPVSAAPPHIWVTVEVNVLFDSQHRITGLQQIWIFNSGYSMGAVDGLEQDAQGNYTPAAMAQLAKDNLESLKESNYFTEVHLGNTKVDFAVPDRAILVLDGENRLHLDYVLPLKEPQSLGSLKFSFAVYDRDWEIGFSFAKKDAIHLAKGAPAGCASVVQPPIAGFDFSKRWGRSQAATVVVTCK